MSVNVMYPPIYLATLITALIALGILWNQKYRPWKNSKGIPTRTFGKIIAMTLTLNFKEDKKPLGKTKLTPKTLSWITFALILTLGTLNLTIPSLALTLTYLIAIYARTKTVFQERNQIQQRMFEVANSEFRYPRGAEMQPWSYVNIKRWEDATQPGETIVTFPAAYRSDDPKKREEFENHFSGTVSAENSWAYEWDSPHGIVNCKPVSHLPTMAEYPGSTHLPWNKIPIGVGINGEVSVDLIDSPHFLVCGSTGGGKSVFQRNIIFHCIQNPDEWRFLGIDLKRVELTQFKKYEDVVLGIAVTLEDGVEVMRFARDEMMSRYEMMENLGITHFKDSPNPPPALMVMIDEAYIFMSAEGKTGETRDLHIEATDLVGEIARLGRAAGVHLVVATQRPDAKVIYGEIKANLTTAYAAGRLNSTASGMILDSSSGTRIPGNIKGRGIVSVHGREEHIQGYFSKANWIDEWLEQNNKNSSASEDTLIDIPDAFDDGIIESRFAAKEAVDILEDDLIHIEDLADPQTPTPVASPAPVAAPTLATPALTPTPHAPPSPTPVPQPLPRPTPLPLPTNTLPTRPHTPSPSPTLPTPQTAPQTTPQTAPQTPATLPAPTLAPRPTLTGVDNTTKKEYWDDQMDDLFSSIPQE